MKITTPGSPFVKTHKLPAWLKRRRSSADMQACMWQQRVDDIDDEPLENPNASNVKHEVVCGMPEMSMDALPIDVTAPTAYVAPPRARSFDEMLDDCVTMEFHCGEPLGMLLTETNDQLQVTHVYPSSQGERCGIMAGSLIVACDDVLVRTNKHLLEAFDCGGSGSGTVRVRFVPPSDLETTHTRDSTSSSGSNGEDEASAQPAVWPPPGMPL